MAKIKVLTTKIFFKEDKMTDAEFERLVSNYGVLVEDLKKHHSGGLFYEFPSHSQLSKKGGWVISEEV